MKFFISGYGSNGKCIALVDAGASGCTVEPLFCTVGNPSWVLPNKAADVLYAVSELDPDGGLAAFDITRDGLKERSTALTGGADPCHLALSGDERFLYVSNYTSGSVSVFRVDGSRIIERVQLIEHGPGAHAHSVTFGPDDGRAYVCDLGLDTVFVYDADPETGLLTEYSRAVLPKGTGPRHPVFDGGKRIYTACELASVLVYFENDGGNLKMRQSASTLPNGYPEKSYVSAVRIFDGCVYVANRGHDSVAKFRLNADGTFNEPEFIPTGASYPRDFRVFDGDVWAANEKGGCVTLNGKKIYKMERVSCITETVDI